MNAAYARVYSIVRRIPRGRVAPYGQVAALCGLAGQPRRVGYALHSLPSRSGIPWHRVLSSEGRLSLARIDPGAALEQRLRLEQEGVRFDARGRVSLSEFAWRPRRRPASRARRTRVRS